MGEKSLPSVESRRARAFKKSDEEIVELWRGIDRDDANGLFLVEEMSLLKAFSTLIREVDWLFRNRDDFADPKAELLDIMDYGSRLLARLLSFSNIKSGRIPWLTVMFDNDGKVTKLEDIKKRLAEEKAKGTIPVRERKAIDGGSRWVNFTEKYF